MRKLWALVDEVLTLVNGAVVGNLTVTGRVISPGTSWASILTKTANYTILDTDPDIVQTGAISGHVTITLPTAADNTGRVITVLIVEDPGESNVVIDGEGAEPINRALTKSCSDQFAHIRLYCNGSEWFIIGSSGTWA